MWSRQIFGAWMTEQQQLEVIDTDIQRIAVEHNIDTFVLGYMLHEEDESNFDINERMVGRWGTDPTIIVMKEPNSYNLYITTGWTMENLDANLEKYDLLQPDQVINTCKGLLIRWFENEKGIKY